MNHNARVLPFKMHQYQQESFSRKIKVVLFLNSQCAHPAISVAPLSTEKANILRYQFDLHSIEDLKYQLLEKDNKIILIKFATDGVS